MQGVDIIEQMNEYYEKRADIHDTLMGYVSNDKTERLLAPVIRRFEHHIKGRDILEIACGTGNWTQVLARRAKSVVATDINDSVLNKAREKEFTASRVTFKIADAYRLSTLGGKYGAAFAADWWSHIPKSKIERFIKGLHRKLKPGSPVIFTDMLPFDALHRMFSHYDDEGNLIHKRDLPNGKEYYVVKNFPTESELRGIFGDIADDVDYYEHYALHRWILTYRTK